MLPRGGNGHPVDVLPRLDRAGDALHTVVGNLRNPHLAPLGMAATDSPEGGLDGIQKGIVPVQEDQPAFPQVLEDLAFCL